MTVEPTAAEIEAAARALADPYGHAPESFRPAISAHIAAGRALVAALPLVEARLREQIAAEIEDGPLREGEGATRCTLAEYVRHGGEPRCGAVGPAEGWSCVLHVGHDHRHWARDVSWSQ